MFLDNREAQRASVLGIMEVLRERVPAVKELLTDWEDMHEGTRLNLVHDFLRHCAALYYNDGCSLVSDATFDELNVTMIFMGYPAADFENRQYI